MSNLWQHSIWDQLQRSMGLKTWKLEVSGASALLIKRDLPFGFSYFEVPRGPVFNDQAALHELMKKVQELATQEGAVFVRMSPYKELKLDNAVFKMVNAMGDHHPETSLTIDLNQSEEEILALMKPKGRYNIKVAQKHNVVVEQSDDVETFHHLLKKTGMRDGFGIHPQKYYQNMLQALGQHGQLLVAKYEDRVIAGGIFVYLNDEAIYYYGASDHHYRTQMAPYLIQWEAIKEAKKRGCKTYDFLGVAPEDAVNHPWVGVTSFKKKFGGQTVSYPQAKDMILKPFWYFMYKLKKGAR